MLDGLNWSWPLLEKILKILINSSRLKDRLILAALKKSCRNSFPILLHLYQVDSINQWKACFVEVSEKEYFLGFLLNKCTQVVQIEIIQMIRRVLISIYRTHDGTPEQHASWITSLDNSFYENCDKDKNYYCKKKKPFILEAIRNDFNRFESIQMGSILESISRLFAIT